MPILKLEKRGTVAVLNMTQAENRHNLNFALDFQENLEEVLADESISSLVIGSTAEENWSLGLDLGWMNTCAFNEDSGLIRQFLEGMDNLYKTLLTFPIPVIAAINGHTVGSGAALACACDFRFMRADQGHFCFPEIDLSIDFVPGDFAFIQGKLPSPVFNELLLTGKKVDAMELEQLGVISKACRDLVDLNQSVFTFAASMQKSRRMYGKLKRTLHQSYIRIAEEQNPMYYDALLDADRT